MIRTNPIWTPSILSNRERLAAFHQEMQQRLDDEVGKVESLILPGEIPSGFVGSPNIQTPFHEGWRRSVFSDSNLPNYHKEFQESLNQRKQEKGSPRNLASRNLCQWSPLGKASSPRTRTCLVSAK